jgi:predicted DNA-binding transcriptional regulator AlpA
VIPKLLRFADLKKLGIVANWTTLLRLIANGDFPSGRYISPNCRAWTEDEVAEWLASCPQAMGKGRTAA